MNTKIVCPVCGEGNLTTHSTTRVVKYGDRTGDVAFSYSVCSSCESEVATSENVRLNKRAMVAFRKRVDGLLSGAEVRALRDKFCLTQEAANRIFGGGPVAFSKYENDDVAQSEQMDSLLRLVIDDSENLVRLALRKGIAVTVPLSEHPVVTSTARYGGVPGVQLTPRDQLRTGFGGFEVSVISATAKTREDSWRPTDGKIVVNTDTRIHQ